MAKAGVSPLLAKDGSTLKSDEDKLQQWSKHFSSVANCSSIVSVSVLDAFPVVAAGLGAGCLPSDDSNHVQGCLRMSCGS